MTLIGGLSVYFRSGVARLLKKSEIDLIRQWIKEGAEWEEHWSYIPPVKPDLPDQFDPWVTNPIDHYVLNKMQEKVQANAEDEDAQDTD